MKKNIDLIVNGIAPEKVMYDTDNHSLVVLYPAQKDFKRGDILASDNKTLLIFDEYATYNKEKDILHSLWNNIGTAYNKSWTSKNFAHATEEQKAQVHELLRKEGKKWNAETLEIEDLDISEIAVDLESACEYLGCQKYIYNADRKDKRLNKFEAQITLQLIREAWNKADGFAVDWDDYDQAKHYPVLNSDGSIKYYTLSKSKHISASCLSFPTQERALQFGNQFKELFKIAMGYE